MAGNPKLFRQFRKNIGVVVAGRRRFTLFPPEQIANLYIGPLELTPAGTPVSMVDPTAPDLQAYPRYAEALKCAQQAILEPGDAIYIPYHWWHAVDSLDPFNFFINYWWSAAGGGGVGQNYEALAQMLRALRPLSPQQREVWRHVFDYYILTAGDPGAHLPLDAQGMLKS